MWEKLELAHETTGCLKKVQVQGVLCTHSVIPPRVHAVAVCDTADYFYNHVDEQLGEYGLTKDAEGKPLKARDLVDIIEGYKGLGYGRSTDEELGEILPVLRDWMK